MHWFKTFARAGFVAFAIGLAPAVEAGINDGLIGHWPLNGDADDHSPNGYDFSGTLPAHLSFVPNPAGDGQVLQVAKGLSGDQLDLPVPASEHPGQEDVDFKGSGAFWVMFDDADGRSNNTDYQPILSNAPGIKRLERHLSRSLVYGKVWRDEKPNSNKNYYARTPDESVSAEGVWYHFAWTFDAHYDGEPGAFRWYVNGELKRSYEDGIQTQATSGFRIGALPSGYSANVKIAQVRLYDRILTEDEIRQLAHPVQVNGYPEWWGVSASESLAAKYANGPPESDYSPLLLGQLKHFAAAGRDQLDLYVGGAGPSINALADSFTAGDPDDHTIANVGQLKYVSSKFFDRFEEIGFGPGDPGWPASLILDEGSEDFSPAYPWRNDLTASAQSPALIGQAKHLFSWDLAPWLEELETLWDEVPDSWKNNIVHDPYAAFYDPEDLINSVSDVLANDDYDGDGRSNLQEYLDGSDAWDYYNGEAPTLEVWWGDSQTVPPNTFASKSLYVKVTDAAGEPYVNAPVAFDVNDGHQGLSAKRSVDDLEATKVVRTHGHGAQVYFYSPSGPHVSTINALTPGPVVALVSFSITTNETYFKPPYNLTSKDNGDGTTTFTFRFDGPADEVITLREEQPRGSGNWTDIATIDLSNLTPTDGNLFTATVDFTGGGGSPGGGGSSGGVTVINTGGSSGGNHTVSDSSGENTNETDPSNEDTDGDGLTDHDEVHLYGTLPDVTDSDGDGKDDGEDGVPYDPYFSFDAPTPSFAILDLGQDVTIKALNENGTVVYSRTVDDSLKYFLKQIGKDEVLLGENLRFWDLNK